MKAGIALTSLLSRWWLGRLLLAAAGLVLVGAFGFAQERAAADGDPQFTSMAVSVMPEYDQPRVLVSYRGELGSDVALPLQARIRLPADATIEHVCSIKVPEEEHICQPYTTQSDGEYLAVNWEAVTPVMYVEFYYGSVSGAGERSLDYTFLPPYSVQSLDLFVLEPAGASDFTLSPAPADTVEEQGFRHHSYSFEAVSAAEPLTIEMSYSRDTDQPSAPPRAAAAAGDGDSIPQGVLVSLGLVGAGVLAIAVLTVVARRAGVHLLPVSQRSRGSEGSRPGVAGFFCRSCGAPVSREFAFCPGCGQEVRAPPEVET